jgi:hypothetical protein
MSLICLACFWEDDAFVVDELDCYSVCNHMPLRQARSNFIELGACDSTMLVNVLPVSERARFERRPLPAGEPES